jgi:hypothetical protein
VTTQIQIDIHNQNKINELVPALHQALKMRHFLRTLGSSFPNSLEQSVFLQAAGIGRFSSKRLNGMCRSEADFSQSL